jgi:hypothetical protein
MKKFFAMLAAVSCTMALSATSYMCHLKVVINDVASEQDQVEVVVTQENGAYNLSLKNFCLVSDGVTMPVGNIAVSGVEGVNEYGYTTINFSSPINITPGDDPNFNESDWIGPLLGDVPIDLTARFIGTALSANIDINMVEMLGQVINVSIFGVAPALKGDVNNDNEVNIADVNSVIDIILAH